MHPLDRRRFLATSALLTAFGAGAAQAQTPPAPAAAAPSGTMPNPKPRGETVELNGAKIFYEISGKGSPILLIHGYPLSGALFARVRDALSAQHQVITMDLRGYGQSHAPSAPDTIDVYAKDALSLLQHLKVERAAIGGMSMGGPIVLDMYKQAPERFSGLALIDTTAAAAKPFEAGLWQGIAKMVRQNGPDSIIPALLPFMLTGETRLNQKPQVEFLRTVMMQASKEAALGGAEALEKRPDMSALLPTIKVPTVVLVGIADGVYPVEIAQMTQQMIPGSTLAMIPNAAHAAVFEQPEQSGQALMAWAGKAA